MIADDQIKVMYGARALNGIAFLALSAGTFVVAKRLYGRAAAATGSTWKWPASRSARAPR